MAWESVYEILINGGFSPVQVKKLMPTVFKIAAVTTKSNYEVANNLVYLLKGGGS